MKKRGRKRSELSRTIVRSFRFTASELAELTRRARARRLSVAQYIRDRALA